MNVPPLKYLNSNCSGHIANGVCETVTVGVTVDVIVGVGDITTGKQGVFVGVTVGVFVGVLEGVTETGNLILFY